MTYSFIETEKRDPIIKSDKIKKYSEPLRIISVIAQKTINPFKSFSNPNGNI